MNSYNLKNEIDDIKNDKIINDIKFDRIQKQIDDINKELKLLEDTDEDLKACIFEHDFVAMESSIISLEHDRIHVKKTEERISELFTALERIEKGGMYKELQELKNGTPQERLAVLEGKISKLETENFHIRLELQHQKGLRSWDEHFKPSIPNFVSLAHIEHPLPPDLVDSLIQLWQAYEKHRLHDSKNHEKVDPRKPCISRYTFSDSFPNILYPDLLSSRQTSTLRESFERFLFQLRVRVLALHGNSILVSELSQVSSFLMSTPELECRVEQYEDRIHLQFLDGNHPEHVHSEIILRLNSHSS